MKILIIRFSSIGDIVLTSPIIRCLKEQLEGEIEIHYLTKVQFAEIIEHNQYVDQVYTIEQSTDEIMSNLKKERYDYVIDLHKNIRSKRVIRKLKVLSFTFDKLNYKKWLLTAFKINKLPDIHIVDRYFEAVGAFGIINDKKGLDFVIPDRDKVALNKFPIAYHKEYVSFAIGAQHATKRLPTNKIISICQQIGQPVILLGGNNDKDTGDEIVKAVGGNILNACGRYSICQSASLIKQSTKLITHDTGLMHIGVALGVKIVSIWGNTVPEFGMYPYYPTNPEKYKIVENKNLNCRPCSKIGYDRCPKKHFNCMNKIDDEVVIKALKEI